MRNNDCLKFEHKKKRFTRKIFKSVFACYLKFSNIMQLFDSFGNLDQTSYKNVC